MAKHSKDGIGFLDEEIYRCELWDHKPIPDFWRVGRGSAAQLERYGIYTMGQIAAADEALIYRIFGIEGELLIDHAWGRETATIEDIKGYSPKPAVSPQDRCCLKLMVMGRLNNSKRNDRSALPGTCGKAAGDRLHSSVYQLLRDFRPTRRRKRLSAILYMFPEGSSKNAWTDFTAGLHADNLGARKINITFNGAVPDIYEGFDLSQHCRRY